MKMMLGALSLGMIMALLVPLTLYLLGFNDSIERNSLLVLYIGVLLFSMYGFGSMVARLDEDVYPAPVA